MPTLAVINPNIHTLTQGFSKDIESNMDLEAVRPLCVTYCCEHSL